MKFNSLYLAGLCALALFATACSDDVEYTPAAPVQTPDCYFSTMDNSKFVLGEADNSVTINLYRSEKGKEATMPVNITITPTPELFNIPATATFEADSYIAPITITFGAGTLEGGVPYEVKCVVGSGQDSPYFLQTLNASITYAPWTQVIGENGEEFALMDDVMISAIFTITPSPAYEYEVVVEETPVHPGLYRVVNPYAAGKPYTFINAYDNGIKDTYLYFNCADPQKVFISDENGNYKTESGDLAMYVSNVVVSGNEQYGQFEMTSVATYAMWRNKPESEYADYYGTLKDGVITFEAETFYVTMSNYGDWGTASGGATDIYPSRDKFRLQLPGSKEVIPENWEQLGDAQFTDGLVAPLYDLVEDGVCPTYAVPVEINADEEGIYRLVNPYKIDVNPDYGTDYSGDVYIKIDATNPECVLVPFQKSGFEDEERGELWCFNYAYNMIAGGANVDEVIDTGYNDVFADGKFVFGSEYEGTVYPQLLGFYPKWSGHEDEIWPNPKEAGYYTVIELPSAAKTPARHVVTSGARYIRNAQIANYGRVIYRVAASKLGK